MTEAMKLKMLASWKKSYVKPRQCFKRQRHHFANKGPSSQSNGFPAVVYGCESWTIKKVELWRIDTFKLWCWRRLLRVPWIARRYNQSILNIYWKDWCWSCSSNTLATWWEELTHLERPWCWEKLRTRREEGDRGRDCWMVSLTQWTWVWANLGRQWWTEKPSMLQSMGLQIVRHELATEQQQQQM